MKLHKFRTHFHDAGAVKYHAGAHYEPNEETRVAVAQGHAEEVDAHAQLACVPFAAAPALAAVVAPAFDEGEGAAADESAVADEAKPTKRGRK